KARDARKPRVVAGRVLDRQTVGKRRVQQRRPVERLRKRAGVPVEQGREVVRGGKCDAALVAGRGVDLLPASVLVSGPVVVKTQRRPQNRSRADGVADTEARSESAVPVVLEAAAVAPAIGGGEGQCAWPA